MEDYGEENWRKSNRNRKKNVKPWKKSGGRKRMRGTKGLREEEDGEGRRG